MQRVNNNFFYFFDKKTKTDKLFLATNFKNFSYLHKSILHSKNLVSNLLEINICTRVDYALLVPVSVMHSIN